MARSASPSSFSSVLVRLAFVGLLGAGFGACLTSGSSGSGGGGGANPNTGTASGGSNAGGAPAPVVNHWWVTCPLFGCPDVPDADKSLPCSADEHEGIACNYPGTTCDLRLPCGAVLLCTGNDPKGNGCP